MERPHEVESMRRLDVSCVYMYALYDIEEVCTDIYIYIYIYIYICMYACQGKQENGKRGITRNTKKWKRGNGKNEGNLTKQEQLKKWKDHIHYEN